VAVADSGGTGDVAVLLGSGDGKLGAATKMAAQNPGAIAAGDANGDGKVDLVVTHLVSLHPMEGIGVFAGKGDGTFLGYVPYASGMGPQAVTMADLDGDGKVDLAVANKDSNDVSVLLGVPGGFGAPSPVPAGALAVDVVVADFNRDGKLDLAVANQGGKVRILLGKGNGAFNPPLGHPANKNPRSLAVADFNGDGKPDLAVANSTSGDVSVLLNSF
jgi:Tfp pilus tip-associated adhesin PilY1